MQETIHLLNGEIIQADVNGLSMTDKPQTGSVFIPGSAAGSLRQWLESGHAIKVQRGNDGDWYETNV